MDSVKTLIESFERWTEESDPSAVPPYILALISTPARDLHLSSPQRVFLNNTLLVVLEAFKSERYVVFTSPKTGNGDNAATKDCVCGRLSFIEQAFVASSLVNEFSTVANSVRTLASVQAHETLDVVLCRMLTSGFEEVCIVDDGIVIGVLHLDEVFNFLTKELSMLGCELLSMHTIVLDSREASEEDQALTVQSSSDIEASMEKKKTEYRMSPLQLSAQQFSKGYWTEFLLICCITLDVTSSIVEYLSPAPDDGPNLPEEKLQVSNGIIRFVRACPSPERRATANRKNQNLEVQKTEPRARRRCPRASSSSSSPTRRASASTAFAPSSSAAPSSSSTSPSSSSPSSSTASSSARWSTPTPRPS